MFLETVLLPARWQASCRRGHALWKVSALSPNHHNQHSRTKVTCFPAFLFKTGCRPLIMAAIRDACLSSKVYQHCSPFFVLSSKGKPGASRETRPHPSSLLTLCPMTRADCMWTVDPDSYRNKTLPHPPLLLKAFFPFQIKPAPF